MVFVYTLAKIVVFSVKKYNVGGHFKLSPFNYSILITFVFVVISVEYSYYLLLSIDKDLVFISFDTSRVVYVSDSINSEQI